MNENDMLEEMIKINLKQLIEHKVNIEIEETVYKLKEKLENRKDEYIAEIMKGIRFHHEYNDIEHCMNYKIIFENVTRVEPRTGYKPGRDSSYPYPTEIYIPKECKGENNERSE